MGWVFHLKSFLFKVGRFVGRGQEKEGGGEKREKNEREGLKIAVSLAFSSLDYGKNKISKILIYEHYKSVCEP